MFLALVHCNVIKRRELGSIAFQRINFPLIVMHVVREIPIGIIVLRCEAIGVYSSMHGPGMNFRERKIFVHELYFVAIFLQQLRKQCLVHARTIRAFEVVVIDRHDFRVLSSSHRTVRGTKNAKVVAVNYDDFECPYCSRMHQTLFPQLLKEYGDKIEFVYKDFPLSEIHPWAMHAAVNANCLASQNNDAYWDFADYMHNNQREINSLRSEERRVGKECRSRWSPY